MHTFIFKSTKIPHISVDYDTGLKKEALFEIINELEKVGISILSTTCDQGGENNGLAKNLNINLDNVTFENPADKERDIAFTFDFIHAFKNVR